MDSSNISCPVCTLYLRPGITLKSHLASHPKQKVIEALVRLSEGDIEKIGNSSTQIDSVNTVNTIQSWNQNLVNMPPNIPPGNHVFIYQQSMSTTSQQQQQQQQYVIPTMINPQIMPYIYQQQVIMSGSCMPMRQLPYELPTPLTDCSTETESNVSEHHEKIEEIEDEPDGKIETEAYEEEPELNKACQTQTSEESLEEQVVEEDKSMYFMPDLAQNYEYAQAEQLDFDMDGMHVVINEINDFGTSQIISQVENFEEADNRPGVLMTIGGMKDDFVDQTNEESMSRESTNVNIRADEKMPPRGELSGQESIGSDVTWNRVQYNEGSSGMSTSYDLLARENWEASDSSDVDVPPLQSRVPPPYQEEPALTYKCEECDDVFTCLRERREHEAEKHRRKPNQIGTEIGKNKVKKLVIKVKPKSEPPPESFDNVFTNKLKLEQEDRVEEPEVKTEDVELKTVCPLCDCVLLNAKALREHKIQVHNVTALTRHRCMTCGEQFPNDYKFSEHLRIHPLECKICGRLFYRRQNIQLHMRRHLGIKPYKCDVCEKSFLTKQKLDEHRNIHTGEAPIKCPLCDETFRRHSNLVQHRNRHHLNLKKKVKDYICFCKEVFHSKKKLAWHKEIHDAKPKSCTHCSEKFIHMSSLTRHMRRAHNHKFLPSGHKNAENVECPICKGTYLKSSLEVHIRNHSGQRPYACLICNKDFTTKWNLKLHKWTHASRVAKPFKCDQCKGAFIRESDYVAHMNSHKSIRPYTCNYCGAQFIRKYNCQRHVKEHENAKMFECKVCGKSFHRSYYLKDHMRIHSGVRPYSCNICGKTSTTKSNHNKHVQIHHAREPVSTEN